MALRPGRGKGKKKSSVNCWEFYHCPRDRQMVCPAYQQEAGRACWSIAGTLCGGESQEMNAKMIGNCEICDFFRQVKAGEM